MQVECYAATRPQQGKAANEDAFAIRREPVFYAVLCDGAGNAQLAAKRTLTFFEKLIREATPAQILDGATWSKWIKLLDSSLLGGNQSTFVGLAVVNGEVVGAATGDSRAYFVTRDGEIKILSEGASKFRLGSGRAEAYPLRHPFKPGEILLLLSDGAWTPLGIYPLKRAVQSARHFAEAPLAILDAASRCGRADDMTALALRLSLV